MTLRGRKFQPKLWAFIVTAIFSAITIHLGNWQSDRAEYKISQQAQLDAALSAPPLKFADVATTANVAAALRYRSVELVGSFIDKEVFLLDNRIVDGKVGYGVLQSFRVVSSAGGTERTVLIDRGWVAAALDRAKLPKLETPTGVVKIAGRINQPPSRNPRSEEHTSELQSPC